MSSCSWQQLQHPKELPRTAQIPLSLHRDPVFLEHVTPWVTATHAPHRFKVYVSLAVPSCPSLHDLCPRVSYSPTGGCHLSPHPGCGTGVTSPTALSCLAPSWVPSSSLPFVF